LTDSLNGKNFVGGGWTRHSSFVSSHNTKKHTIGSTNLLTSNMKIDTNKCTPINKASPDSVIIYPNKYIEGSGKLSPQPTETPGRENKYLPTLVFTPVMTSKRTQNNRRLSADDIEELSKKLGSLFILKEEAGKGTVSPETVDEEAKAETNSDPLIPDCALKAEQATIYTPILGRFYKMVFSYKTCTASKVMRSARVA
jgi:hypothetical protein